MWIKGLLSLSLPLHLLLLWSKDGVWSSSVDDFNRLWHCPWSWHQLESEDTGRLLMRHGPQRGEGVGKGLGLSLDTSEQVIKSSKRLSYPFFFFAIYLRAAYTLAGPLLGYFLVNFFIHRWGFFLQGRTFRDKYHDYKSLFLNSLTHHIHILHHLSSSLTFHFLLKYSVSFSNMSHYKVGCDQEGLKYLDKTRH